jgi:hypothetical protein
MAPAPKPSLVTRIRNRTKRALSASPALFIPAFYIFGKHDKRDYLISKDSEIVIDGPPRSANTFAYAAFKFAQGREMRIAHHLHVPAQIIRAVDLGVPAMALIREPTAAIRSLKLIFPYIDENNGLRNWMAYFGHIEPLMDKVVLADFNDVTTDFGTVIDAVNARFGTSFHRFEHTPENVAIVYREIEEMDRRESGGSVTYVARPSQAKDEARAKLSFDFDPELVAAAQALYTKLTGKAVKA